MYVNLRTAEFNPESDESKLSTLLETTLFHFCWLNAHAPLLLRVQMFVQQYEPVPWGVSIPFPNAPFITWNMHEDRHWDITAKLFDWWMLRVLEALSKYNIHHTPPLLPDWDIWWPWSQNGATLMPPKWPSNGGRHLQTVSIHYNATLFIEALQLRSLVYYAQWSGYVCKWRTQR